MGTVGARIRQNARHPRKKGNKSDGHSAGWRLVAYQRSAPSPDGDAEDLGLEPAVAGGRQLGEPDQDVASPGPSAGLERVGAADVAGAGHGPERARGGRAGGAEPGGAEPGGAEPGGADLDRHVGARGWAERDRDRADPDRAAHVQDQAAPLLEPAEHR